MTTREKNLVSKGAEEAMYFNRKAAMMQSSAEISLSVLIIK